MFKRFDVQQVQNVFSKVDAQPFEHTFAPIAFFAALIQCNKTRQKTWDIIKPHNFDYEKLFTIHPSKEETYAFIHEPLLNLACEILNDCKESTISGGLDDDNIDGVDIYNGSVGYDGDKIAVKPITGGHSNQMPITVGGNGDIFEQFGV